MTADSRSLSFEGAWYPPKYIGTKLVAASMDISQKVGNKLSSIGRLHQFNGRASAQRAGVRRPACVECFASTGLRCGVRLHRYVYWRLLSTDPEAAKDVVLAEKPVIADSASSLDPALLNQLLAELSTLASVRRLPLTHKMALLPHQPM